MTLLPALRAAISVFLATTVVACAGSGASSMSEGTALGPDSGPGSPDIGYGMSDLQVGEPFFINLWHVTATGSSLIHLESAKAVGVPSGLVIDNIYAIWNAPNAAYKGWGMDPGPQETIPLSSILLDPTCPPVSHCAPAPPAPRARSQNWVIAVKAHIMRPGRYKTKGLRVVYEVDGRQYGQTFPSVTIDADSNPR
jgi:hypothetical protein